MKRMTVTFGSILLSILLLALPFTAASAAESDEIRFTFTQEGITPSAEGGYEILGTDLTISEAGVYILAGVCDNGSVTVKKGTQDVTLVLEGLELGCEASAPLVCGKGAQVRIIAASGTSSTLWDGEENNDELYPENTEAENAVLKCKDASRVSLEGSGSLYIRAAGKNGIKSGSSSEDGEASLTIRDITLTVDAPVNDGIKADQDLRILSGNITVRAGDDGIKSDLYLQIGEESAVGPVILVAESAEGIEAAEILILSGDTEVHAADDGVNAANSDLTGYAFTCTVSGGRLYVDASRGDGIDSNGTLSITGGTVEVHASSANDNSPLDSEMSFALSGGTVLAVGSSGMAQSPNSTDQPYLSFGFGGMGQGLGSNAQSAGVLSLQAGDELSILDAEGNTLYTGKALRSAGYVFFSSPELTPGESYTLLVNGNEALTQTAGTDIGGFGGMGPGGFGVQAGGGQGAFPGEQSGTGEGGFGERPGMGEGGFPGGGPGMGQGGFPGGGPGMGQGGFPGGQPAEGQNVPDGEPPEMGEGGFPGEPPETGEGGFPGEPPETGEGGFPGEPPEMGEGGFPGEPPETEEGGLPGEKPDMDPGEMPGTPPIDGDMQPAEDSFASNAEPTEAETDDSSRSGQTVRIPLMPIILGGALGVIVIAAAALLIVRAVKH